jgi:hypothetical protein
LPSGENEREKRTEETFIWIRNERKREERKKNEEKGKERKRKKKRIIYDLQIILIII